MKTRILLLAVGAGLLFVAGFMKVVQAAGTAQVNQPEPATSAREIPIDLVSQPLVSAASRWYTETVDSGANVGWFSSLSLDENDNPSISYYDINKGELKFADSYYFSSWWLDILDELGAGNGGETSLQLNADPPYKMISYHDGNKDRLNLALLDENYTWVTQTILTSAGAYNSLVLDTTNPTNAIPHISYYDRNSLDLIYATQDNAGSWYTTTVDDVGDVGMYTSIALNALGEPGISYYDYDNLNLKYASMQAGTWKAEVVDDSPHDVGMDSSLKIDSNNIPHISYYDYTIGDLIYARWDSGASQWITETVDSSGDVGAHTSLVIDSYDHPHISYYDGTDYNLNYAFRSSSGWYTETVDSSGDVGLFSSLALDNNDRPYISYLDSSSQRLLLATIYPRPAMFIVDQSYDGLDAKDANPGDGICADSQGKCTLRAALEENNTWQSSTGGWVFISREMTITIDNSAGALPPINREVLINAPWDQTNDKPIVIIDGDGNSFDGLRLAAGNSAVYGLQIQNFDGAAISISSAYNWIGNIMTGTRNVLSGNTYGVHISGGNATNNLIVGNYIGTHPDGNSALPNEIGIMLSAGAADNLIGGNTSAEGNLISGNTFSAINISGIGSDGNRVGGNIIGENHDHSTNLPNGVGVQVDSGASDTCIGCGGLASNSIMYNKSIGINLISAGTNTQIFSNTISANWDSGIEIQFTRNTKVERNVISRNLSYGVRITGQDARLNNLTGNSIHDNVNDGISLSLGANDDLAAPTIMTASNNGATGSACPGCKVELFSDYTDEGQFFHGATIADAKGSWEFNGDLRGPNLTATATDADGNTSEFSTPQLDILGGTCLSPYQISCGQTVEGEILGHNNNSFGYDCGVNDLGLEVVYAFILPTGNTYTVSAKITSTATLDTVLLSDCSNGICLSPDASGSNQREIEVGDIPAGNYYLVVESQDYFTEDSYKISLSCTTSDFEVLLPLIQQNNPLSNLNNDIWSNQLASWLKRFSSWVILDR